MKTILSYILLLLSAYTSYAQTAMPADFFSYCADPKGNRIKWHDNFGTSVTNYMGYLYLISTENNKYPSVYLFQTGGTLTPLNMQSRGDTSKNYLNYFGYWKEGDYGYTIINQVFMFQYNGRLWYFQNVTSKDKDSCHECYAQLPEAGQPAHSECLAYHEDFYFDHGGCYTYIFKAGAFQLDSSLYFICNKMDPFLCIWDTAWYIQKYAWDNNKKRFKMVSQTALPSNLFGGSQYLGVVFPRYDASKDKYSEILCTYFNRNHPSQSKYFLWKLDISGGDYKIQKIDEYDGPDFETVEGVTAVPGTIQAMRNPFAVPDPYMSDRFTVFMSNPEFNYGTNANLMLTENYFNNDSVIHRYAPNDILIPSGEFPEIINQNSMCPVLPICASYSLNGSLYNPQDSLYGMESTVWVFYPSKNDHYVAAVGFNSDLWLSPPDSVSPRSADLDDDEKYTDNIRNMWTFVGILEGAPPVKMNWEIWDSLYPPNENLPYDPSELILTETASNTIEVACSWEDKITAGANMKVIQEVEGVEIEEGVDFQFSGAYKSRYSKGSTTTMKYSESFPLTRLTQDSGTFIYACPSIVRIPYCRYPWWGDKKWSSTGEYTYVVPNSAQYMFHTDGMSLILEKFPLNGWPFYVSHPNGESDSPDTLMKDWQQANRPEINKFLNHNPYFNHVAAPYISNYVGYDSEFEIEGDNTTSTETSTSYEVSADATVKVPLVFEIGVSAGNEISYNNEGTTKSTMGTGISCEMKNIHTWNQGELVKNEYLKLYWFRPTDGFDYWFYQSDSAQGDKPWYMAWVVTSVNKKVTLVSPGANSMLKDAELQFTWKPEGLDDPEYVFCIASAASINPSTMIYQESVGEATEVIPAGFIPERGKTYYWGVLATCSSGDNVWSNSRAFSMQEDQLPGQDETTLNVKIYPNPGQNKDIHITIGSGQAGTVSVSLFEIHGNLVWRTETDYKGNGPETLSLPDLGLRPGVYLVEVHSATGVTTKKVIISNPY